MEYLTAVIPSPLIQILRLEEIEPTSEVRDPSSWRVVSSESRNLGSKASDRGHYSSFQLDCWRFSPKLRGDIFPARISLRTQIPSRRSSSPRKNGKIGVQMESLRPEIAIEVLVGWGGGGGGIGGGPYGLGQFAVMDGGHRLSRRLPYIVSFHTAFDGPKLMNPASC